jgi:hypothetical protein
MNARPSPRPSPGPRPDPRSASRPDDEDDDYWSDVWDGPTRVTGLQPYNAQLRPCLVAIGALLVPAAVVGGLIAGTVGAVAAVSAIAVVASFFTISALAVAAADRRNPRLTLPVALATYVVKVWIFGVFAFAAVQGNERWHDVFAGALGAGLLAWLGAHVVWFWRSPVPRVEPDDSMRTPAATSATRG